MKKLELVFDILQSNADGVKALGLLHRLTVDSKLLNEDVSTGGSLNCYLFCCSDFRWVLMELRKENLEGEMDPSPISWISFHPCWRTAVVEGCEVVMNGGAGTVVRWWWNASHKVELPTVEAKGRRRKEK
ncbi:hypothetical protein NL676_012553 [Syzygium grande]|nr:hypothetical protein NL676_012553 [Syzygium grande]